MRRAGLPLGDGTGTLILADGTPKRTIRQRLSRQYRILLLLGDSLQDFVNDTDSAALERRETAEQYATYWGRQWIMFPNPMYGRRLDALHAHGE